MVNPIQAFMQGVTKLYDTATGKYAYQKATDGAAHTTLATSIAGERNATSETNNYLAAVSECNYTIVDHADTSPVEISGDGTKAIVFGVYCLEAFAGTPDIALYDGSTEVINLPTAMALGDYVTFPGVKFNTDLDAVIAAAGTAGKVAVFWRAQ